MATIKSSKPGEIGGSSALTGRTPSYRLVLKVDPKTGQYKYEYETDDAPKVADIVPPKTGDNVFGKITIPKIDFKEKKLPDEDSFEQTKKLLAGGGRGPASGESGMPVGGGAQGTGKGLGFGFSGGTGTYSRGTPGSDTFTPGPGIGKAYDEYGRLRDIGKIKDIGLNVVDATGKVVSATKDYVTSGGILGAAKGLIEGITNNKQKTPTTGTSFDDKAVSRGTFEQTKKALGGTADLGSTASVFSDLDPARKNIDDQIAELEEQAKSFTAPRTFIANKIKELEEQKSKLDPTGQFGTIDKRPDAIGLSDKTKVADNTATISNARQGLENAIRSNNVGAAVDAAKTVAGFSGLSRDKAQAAMDQASADASRYGANATGTEKRGVENIGRNDDGSAQPGSIAEARDKVGEQEAEKSRSVDRTNAVGNKARSNEVGDKHGNAVTDSKGNAVNTKSKSKTKSKTKKGRKSSKAAQGGKGGDNECFLAGTMISMADGTKKEVEKIDLGDIVEVGGKVFATGKFLTENLHDYKGIKVSGSHMVNENNKWIRVADSKYSKVVDSNEHTVYVFGSENRRIVIDNILFTDYFEVYEQEKLIKDENDFFDNWHAYGIDRSQENIKVINAS